MLQQGLVWLNQLIDGVIGRLNGQDDGMSNERERHDTTDMTCFLSMG